MASAAHGGPKRLTTPLSRSARARAPHGASGAIIHTNIRQGVKPRNPSPKRDAGHRSVTLTQNLDTHRKQTKNYWSDAPEAWESEKPAAKPWRYIQNQKEVTDEAPADMKEYAKWSPLPKNAEDMINTCARRDFYQVQCRNRPGTDKGPKGRRAGKEHPAEDEHRHLLM